MAGSETSTIFNQNDGGSGGDGSDDDDDEKLVAQTKMRNLSIPEPGTYGRLIE